MKRKLLFIIGFAILMANVVFAGGGGQQSGGSESYSSSLSILRLAQEKRYDVLQNRLSDGNYDDIDMKDNRGRTTLMIAASDGRLNIVKMLVEKGAKLNLRGDNGETAASLAYDRGEVEIVDYLKANGARDFEPLQVQQQTTQNTPQGGGQQGSNEPQKNATTVTVWYTENGTKKSVPVFVMATSKTEAEREAERQWKNMNGWNNKLQFIEAVGPSW